MPTEKPKISAYVPQVVYDRMKEFQEAKGLSMSQAITVVLTEYFGLSQEIESSSLREVSGVSLQAFRELEARVKQLEMNEKLGNDILNRKVDRLAEQVKNINNRLEEKMKKKRQKSNTTEEKDLQLSIDLK